MKIFRKRTSPVENIAFIGVMAAIVVVFSLIAAFLPLGGFIIMVVLPLVATMVALYCDIVFAPIFVVASIGVSIAATAFDFSTTLFYVFPAIITGLIFGLLKKTRIPTPYIIFGVTLTQFGLTYLSILMIKGIYGIDMVDYVSSILGITESRIREIVIPLSLFTYSLSATAISTLFTSIELFYVDKKLLDENGRLFILPIIGIAFSSIGFGLVFIAPLIGYLAIACGLYWTAISVSTLFPKAHLAAYVVSGVSLLIGLACFSIFFNALGPINAFSIFGFMLCGIDAGVGINSLFTYKKKKEDSRIEA